MANAFRPTLKLLAGFSLLALIPTAQAQHVGGLVENRGQWPDEVLYMAQLPGQTVWVTREALVYDFYEVERQERTADTDDPLARHERGIDEARRVRGHVVELRFDGGAPGVARPGRALATRLNYFLGDDPARHASNVPVVEEVTLEGLYDGVALRLRPEAGVLTLTFEADDPARLAAVRLTPAGGEALYDEEGTAFVETSLGRRAVGVIRGHAGADWYAGTVGAGGVQVDLGRATSAGRAGSPAPASAAARSTGEGLVFSTFLGGRREDYANAVAVGADGSTTVAGRTESPNFPATSGAYDETHNGGNTDAFVARLSADGASLLYATFLGGTSSDVAYAVAVSADGSATVAGVSGPAFPTTPGAYDETYNGGLLGDAFVARLSADGASLLYATFLGGTGSDYATAVAVGADGSATVAGSTYSSDFPTTPGAYDETYNGGDTDAFVARLSADGTSLLYSTFLGGTGSDFATSLTVGGDGSATVAGYTGSGFPTTPGAYDETFNGDQYDAFVARLNADGTNLLYSTFLGGTEYDIALAVAVGADGSATVAGTTESLDFPTTSGAYDETYNAGNTDAFVARLSADGASLLYATFLGGTFLDIAFAAAVGADGSATVAGYTTSSGFPTTSGAYDETHNGRWDAFVARLSADGASLLYSTFLGGTVTDRANAVAVGADGSAIVAGLTDSRGGFPTGFPTTPGAYDETYNGGFGDAFVAAFQLPGTVAIAMEPIGGPIVIPPGGGPLSYDLSVSNSGTGSATFDYWIVITGAETHDPLRTPRVFTLAGGQTFMRTVTQRVPAAASAGSYTYTINVGSFPGTVLASDSFAFDKTAPSAGRAVGLEVGAPGDIASATSRARMDGVASTLRASPSEAWTSDWETGEWVVIDEATGLPLGVEAAASAPEATATAGEALPLTSTLYAAAPNPFNPTTLFRYDVATPGYVEIVVYDVLGREVARLVDEMKEPGRHQAIFDASRLASGFYVVRMSTGAFVQTQRVTRIR